MARNIKTHYRIVGEQDIIELKSERTWTPADGVSTVRKFVGPAQKIADKFNTLTATSGSVADEIGERYNGQSGELSIRVVDDSGAGTGGGNTEELNSVWELIPSNIDKPIESHRGFDSISAVNKRAIEKAARDGVALPAAANEYHKSLYAYYAHGVMDYVSTNFILRKTTILSSRSDIQVSYTGINTVVSLSTIDPPTRLLGVLTSLPRLGTTPGAWEWQKRAPQMRQISKSKYQLIYEWWGAERWATIYGGSWQLKYEIS